MTWVAEPTAEVVTGKVAEVAPAATVTLAGTEATDVLPLASVITAPPEGATASSVTVPVDPDPPVTLVGLTETDEITGGFTLREAFWLPLKVPVTVT